MKIVSKEIAIKLRDLGFSCGSHYIYLNLSNKSIHISEDEDMAQYMSDNEASDHSLSNYEILEFTGSYENVECEAPYISDVEAWLEQQGYHVGVYPYFSSEDDQIELLWKYSIVIDNTIMNPNFIADDDEPKYNMQEDCQEHFSKEEAWETAIAMCLINIECDNDISNIDADEF